MVVHGCMRGFVQETSPRPEFPDSVAEQSRVDPAAVSAKRIRGPRNVTSERNASHDPPNTLGPHLALKVTGDTTSRVRKLFEQAIDIADLEERQGFLRGSCGSNGKLLRRVTELLAAHEGAGRFLPADSPDNADPGSPVEMPGTPIGHYRLLEQLGEGGFGVVWKADQTEPVKRKVALKILKLGMDSKQVVARFELERQALALMDHPSIAKVFDAGATNAGRPYFVMELVSGIPITEYCDRNRLSVRDRLELFIQVCRAVQHAHQKGIIHRDLKPSNILVVVSDSGSPGVPKVIDFGVAKATQQELTEKTLFTQFHHFIGTPSYMSPEQAQMTSADVDTRSDIYSLGVLLYELLTGQTPFSSKELLASGLEEMCRIIREKEPPRPSTRLRLSETRAAPQNSAKRSAPRTPHPAIDPDLDWIVMKCLEKDRSRRYETANGLAADLERYLNDEPVVARPPTAMYRFRKLARRNRMALTVSAAGALVLIVASVVSLQQAYLARRAAREAREQRETAEAVKNFLVQQLLGGANAFTEPVPDPNKRPTVERVARELEGKFPNQPDVEAEIRYALGEAFDSLDLYPEAAAQWQKTLEIRGRLMGQEHPETILAAARLALAYERIPERRSEALTLARDTVAAVRRSPSPWSLGSAWALGGLAYILNGQGHPAEALPHAHEAIEILNKIGHGADLSASENMWTVAHATEQLGRLDEAARLYDEGLAFCQRTQSTNHPMTAAFLRGQAILWQKRGQPEKAVPLLEQALSLQRSTLPPDHLWIAVAEYLLAQSFEQLKRPEEAAARFAETVPKLVKHLPLNPARSFPLEILRFLIRNNYYDRAETAYQQIKSALQGYSPREPWTFDLLTRITAELKGWPAVAELYRESMDQYADSKWVWLNKAWVFRYVRDEVSYQSVVANVLAMEPRFTSLEDRRLMIEVASLGPVSLSAEQLRQLEALMQGLQLDLPKGTADQQAWGYRSIGQLQFQLGHPREGLEALEKSAPNQAGVDPYGLLIKSACLHRLGQNEEAQAVFKAADSAINRLLPGPLAESEPFLLPHQLYQQVLMRREVGALLATR
jgi:eukaryotic-like serine/threonine-protein kinase